MAEALKPLTSAVSGEAQEGSSAFQAALRQYGLWDHDNMLPAQVISYDRAKNVATVKPLIYVTRLDKTVMSRNQLARIPVFSFGGGGFHINFPLQPGDIGWILAADRDLSVFKQKLSEAPPATTRVHKFADGWFIPDVFYKYTISSDDASAMVIQTTDGATRISITPGNIKITAPSKVTVTTPLAEFSQDVHIKGNLTIDQNLTVTGQTAVNGGFSSAGSSGTYVTLPANTTIGGVNVLGHGHIQNGTSGRTSNGMIT